MDIDLEGDYPDMARIFLISDNHFSDYDGIIQDLNRSPPFESAEKMNAAMIERWNNVVQPDDIVFNLGDFAWLRDEMVHYSNKLNGKKCFILGNHDFEGNRWWLNEKNFDNAVFPLMNVLTYNNQDFLLIHRPEDVPNWWKGWVIHGHHHWMLPKFPFVDGIRKTSMFPARLLIIRQSTLIGYSLLIFKALEEWIQSHQRLSDGKSKIFVLLILL